MGNILSLTRRGGYCQRHAENLQPLREPDEVEQPNEMTNELPHEIGPGSSSDESVSLLHEVNSEGSAIFTRGGGYRLVHAENLQQPGEPAEVEQPTEMKMNYLTKLCLEVRQMKVYHHGMKLILKVWQF